MKKYLILFTFIIASVTHYTAESSCHNPKNGGCLTASGKIATVNITAACPKKLKLGTRIKIDGRTYECQDRYADWVEKKFGNTFDIFTDESLKEAFKFGRKKMQIEIYQKNNI